MALAAGLAEWLDLHGMTAAQMLALIAVEPPPAESEPGPEPEPPFSPTAEACWALAADALTAAMPEGRTIIACAREKTRRNFAADPARFPRAFTLWEDEGAPYVSCAFLGRRRDLLILAHEFGHCCQFWASQSQTSPGTQPPPILRETAAFLAELLLLNHLARTDPPLHLAALALFQAQTRRIMTSQGQRLKAALRAGSGRYRYDWNYPPARAAALHLARQQQSGVVWSAFAGGLSLPVLLGIGQE